MFGFCWFGVVEIVDFVGECDYFILCYLEGGVLFCYYFVGFGGGLVEGYVYFDCIFGEVR